MSFPSSPWMSEIVTSDIIVFWLPSMLIPVGLNPCNWAISMLCILVFVAPSMTKPVDVSTMRRPRIEQFSVWTTMPCVPPEMTTSPGDAVLFSVMPGLSMRIPDEYSPG